LKRRVLVGNSFQEIDYIEKVEVRDEKVVDLGKDPITSEPILPRPDIETIKADMLKYCAQNAIAVTGKLNKTQILELIEQSESAQDL
jgi:hypothetical protein